MKSKIKIMKTRPEVTEAEITRFMDFDALLKQKEQIASRQRFDRWRNVATVAICILMITALTVVMWWRQAAPPENSSTEKELSPRPTTASVDSAQSDVTASEKKTGALPRVAKPDAAPVTGHDERKALTPSEKESVAPEPSGYVQAEPVDGYAALYSYFDEQLRYPASAIRDSIEGVVNVAFAIDINGKATKVTVQHSLGEAFDAEVRRLLRHMPEWRPATYDGKPVESRVSLPITFSLDRNINP